MLKRSKIDRSQIVEGDWMIEAANEPQEVKDIREALEKYIRTIIPEYSVVLIHCPQSDLEQVAKSLGQLNENLLHMRIVFVACPENMKVTVIPGKSEVSLEHEPQG